MLRVEGSAFRGAMLSKVYTVVIQTNQNSFNRLHLERSYHGKTKSGHGGPWGSSV